MKFFIVLALVSLASAVPNYGSYGNYGSRSVLRSGSSFGSGLSGSYGSGLALGGSYGSGLALGGLTAAPVGNVAVLQAIPVQLAASQQVVAAPSLSLGASYGGSYGGSLSSAQVTGPITAAIQSTRNVQVVDVASNVQAAAPAQIVIGPSVQPIDIEFQSQSSPVSVRQTHIPGQANAPQSSSHQEEPDILRQEIVKPVIHEVTEAIQPYRRITQEVRPVQETISQLITRGQQQQTVQASNVNLASSQLVAAPAASLATTSYQAQPAATNALLLITGNQNLGSSGLSLGSSYTAQPSLSLGASYGSGSLLGSSLGSSLSGSSLGGSSFGSLSGSSFTSKPASVSTSLGVDNYRRRA